MAHAESIHLTDAEAHAATALQHHFDNMEQQREAGALGMWLFLITEIMFFGAMFTGYVIYRTKYAQAFAVGSHGLNWKFGAFNTAVLICSSLTMALAVYFAQVGVRQMQIVMLVITMLLGLTFLGVKAIEYHEKYVDHHIPSPIFGFNWKDEDIPHEVPEASRPALKQNIEMFYWIYFVMTGLHALHMIIGIGVMCFLIYFAWRGRYTPEYHAPVELSGLYWHFVDIVWIFLFPLLYLLGANVKM